MKWLVVCITSTRKSWFIGTLIENILVSLTAPVHIKLSEFSLMEQFSFHDTFHNGFECKEYLTWIAPEVVKKRKINSSKDQIAEFAFHSTL